MVQGLEASPKTNPALLQAEAPRSPFEMFACGRQALVVVGAVQANV